MLELNLHLIRRVVFEATVDAWHEYRAVVMLHDRKPLGMYFPGNEY